MLYGISPCYNILLCPIIEYYCGIMLIETYRRGFNPTKALEVKDKLHLQKYIKHQFYKMQIHHHQHALLHRNALQQTCNNEGWHSFTDYCLSSYLSSMAQEFPGTPQSWNLNQILTLLQYGTWTNIFLWGLIDLLFCSDKQIT